MQQMHSQYFDAEKVVMDVISKNFRHLDPKWEIYRRRFNDLLDILKVSFIIGMLVLFIMYLCGGFVMFELHVSLLLGLSITIGVSLLSMILSSIVFYYQIDAKDYTFCVLTPQGFAVHYSRDKSIEGYAFNSIDQLDLVWEDDHESVNEYKLKIVRREETEDYHFPLWIKVDAGAIKTYYQRYRAAPQPKNDPYPYDENF